MWHYGTEEKRIRVFGEEPSTKESLDGPKRRNSDVNKYVKEIGWK